jgi:hypothetical protein
VGLLAGGDLVPVDLALAVVGLLDGGVEDELGGGPDVGAGAVALDEGDDGVVGDVEAVVGHGDGTWFHDDGRFIRADGGPSGFRVYQIESGDGGRSWGEPVVIARHESAHLCEPGLIVSPSGESWALLLRENRRKHNSFAVFSADEGRSWGAPREMPGALTGDRHTAVEAPDGRLFVSFRDTAHESATQGDWVGVGRDLAGHC